MMKLSAGCPALVDGPGEITVTTDTSAAAWDAFVDAHPSASGYHRWRWRTIFEEAFGHETVYLAACRGTGLCGVLPLVIFRSRLFGSFGVSLPFVDGGGVCADHPHVGRLLVQRAASLAAEERLSHIEMRHVTRQLPDLPVRQHKVGMRLRLEPDATRAWNALDRKVRNQVRKAEKSGLTDRSGGIELIDRFYPVFARNMRDLGTPVYSRRLFEQVVSTFPDSSRVFLVEKDGATVAGAIALVHRDSVEVPWASSLKEYRSLCPNNLLYWRIIEHAVRRGVSALEFGRSTPNQGTYQFKEQWGARPNPLYWEYALINGAALPDLTPANPKFRAAVAIWKQLPTAVTNRLGPHIVRSIP